MKLLSLTGIIVSLVTANAYGSKSSASLNSTGSAIENRDEDGSGEGSRFYLERVLRGREISPVPLDLTGLTREQIAQVYYGSYLVNAVGDCSSCHTGPFGFLAGGVRFDIGPGAFVTSRNLTPDPKSGLHLTEDQFIEALRTGKDFDILTEDARLIVMPWEYFRWTTSGDLSAIRAYLSAIPPVSNPLDPDVKPLIPPVPFPDVYDEGDVIRPLPPDTHQALPNVERGLAMQPLEEPDLGHERGVRERFGRGSYIVNSISACSGCHTNPDRDQMTLHINTAQYLSGGSLFYPPPPVQFQLHEARAASANLSGISLGFFHEAGSTFERFLDTIRKGVHVDEKDPRPLAWPMPWENFRNMLDEDLLAIYSYASRVPAREGSADKSVPNYARWCADDSDCRAGETCYTNPATGGINECVGGACAVDDDCDVCQTCTKGACVAPDETSTCLTDGL